MANYLFFVKILIGGGEKSEAANLSLTLSLCVCVCARVWFFWAGGSDAKLKFFVHKGILRQDIIHKNSRINKHFDQIHI